ncbi:MAG: hypothetical protein RBR06_01010 [Desulfuromonadaceae bacterium]|nr:hypothetical protein [Desulfuromonadaceae bacterium]
MKILFFGLILLENCSNNGCHCQHYQGKNRQFQGTEKIPQGHQKATLLLSQGPDSPLLVQAPPPSRQHL